jgi:hypothetical protein
MGFSFDSRHGMRKTDGKDKKAKKEPINLEHLHFYFDGVERDRLDTSGVSRKTGEVLALRDKLLTLPEGEFDAAIKTLKRMVADARKGGNTAKDKAKAEARRRQQAAQLFEQASEAAKTGSQAKAPKVSVV